MRRVAEDDPMARLKARYETRLQEAAHAQAELEKRVFHLKSLYDLSREIGFLNDAEAIIQNLLMMVLGTFGAERGLIVLRDAATNRISAVAHRGLDNAADAAAVLAQHHVAQPLAAVDLRICIPFDVDNETVSIRFGPMPTPVAALEATGFDDVTNGYVP